MKRDREKIRKQQASNTTGRIWRQQPKIKLNGGVVCRELQGFKERNYQF